jgi:ketosteroid isomerase-like protein
MRKNHTLAGRLVMAFGDVDSMKALYSADIIWHLPKGLPRQIQMHGYDEVLRHNIEVWDKSHDPNCRIEILDEVGDDRTSAVRFIYHTRFLGTGQAYSNEYTVFVRSQGGRITHVFEAMDSAYLMDQATGKEAGHTLRDLRKKVWKAS